LGCAACVWEFEPGPGYAEVVPVACELLTSVGASGDEMVPVEAASVTIPVCAACVDATGDWLGFGIAVRLPVPAGFVAVRGAVWLTATAVPPLPGSLQAVARIISRINPTID